MCRRAHHVGIGVPPCMRCGGADGRTRKCWLVLRPTSIRLQRRWHMACTLLHLAALVPAVRAPWEAIPPAMAPSLHARTPHTTKVNPHPTPARPPTPHTCSSSSNRCRSSRGAGTCMSCPKLRVLVSCLPGKYCHGTRGLVVPRLPNEDGVRVGAHMVGPHVWCSSCPDVRLHATPAGGSAQERELRACSSHQQ